MLRLAAWPPTFLSLVFHSYEASDQVISGSTHRQYYIDEYSEHKHLLELRNKDPLKFRLFDTAIQFQARAAIVFGRSGVNVWGHCMGSIYVRLIQCWCGTANIRDMPLLTPALSITIPEIPFRFYISHLHLISLSLTCTSDHTWSSLSLSHSPSRIYSMQALILNIIHSFVSFVHSGQ